MLKLVSSSRVELGNSFLGTLISSFTPGSPLKGTDLGVAGISTMYSVVRLSEMLPARTFGALSRSSVKLVVLTELM